MNDVFMLHAVYGMFMLHGMNAVSTLNVMDTDFSSELILNGWGGKALAWARLYPEEVKAAASVCGAAVCGDYNDVFLGALDAALAACDGTEDSTAAHLKAFGRIYAGWGVGSPFYQDKVWESLGYASLDEFVVQSYEGAYHYRTSVDTQCKV